MPPEVHAPSNLQRHGWRSWTLHLLSTALAAIALFWMVWFAYSYFAPIADGTRDYIYDFSIFRDAAQRALSDGGTLYVGMDDGVVNDFVYPPPGVLPFLIMAPLPLAVGYALQAALILLGMSLTAAMVLDAWQRGRRRTILPVERMFAHALALAIAPVLHNMVLGQLNAHIVTVSVAALWLLARDRALWAGVAVALGFWMKLYPAALLLVALSAPEPKRYLGGFALGLFGIPLVLLPLLPIDLYGIYATQVLPSLSALTNYNTLNQSIAATLLRIDATPALIGSWDYATVTPAMRAATAAFALLTFGSLAAWIWRRQPDTLSAGAALLAVMPCISTLGWESTYALTLPLLLVSALQMPQISRGWRFASMLAVATFVVPKPGDGLVRRLTHWAWDALQHLFFSRFILATVLLLLTMMLATRHLRSPARSDR